MFFLSFTIAEPLVFWYKVSLNSFWNPYRHFGDQIFTFGHLYNIKFWGRTTTLFNFEFLFQRNTWNNISFNTGTGVAMLISHQHQESEQSVITTLTARTALVHNRMSHLYMTERFSPPPRQCNVTAQIITSLACIWSNQNEQFVTVLYIKL